MLAETKNLLGQVNALVARDGRMVSQGSFTKKRPSYATQSSPGLVAQMGRNKRKVVMTAATIGAAIAVTATGAGIVAIPLFFVGYGLKKGVTALWRRKQYNFVAAFLSQAKERGQTYDVLTAIMEHEDPAKALDNLRHWFAHKSGHNIGSFVDRVKAMNEYHIGFRTECANLKGARSCDDAVKATQQLLLFKNMYNGVEEISQVFSGCYLYVQNALGIAEDDWVSRGNAVLTKLRTAVDPGRMIAHGGCGSVCYCGGNRRGKGNYTGQLNGRALVRLFQDAAHSAELFKSGSRNRIDWVKQVLFVKLEGTPLEIEASDVALDAVDQAVTATVWDRHNWVSGVPATISGTLLDSAIKGDNVAEALKMRGADAGPDAAVKSLFGIAGDTAAQAGANISSFAIAAAGALVEIGNSILNKYQLRHSARLGTEHGEVELHSKEGMERLEILRANLKPMMEDWLKAFEEFKKAHEEYITISRPPIRSCLEAYHVARAMLVRQKKALEFLALHQYADEFYWGAIGGVARMAGRFLNEFGQLDTQIDRFFTNGHSVYSDCGGTFCFYFDPPRDLRGLLRTPVTEADVTEITNEIEGARLMVQEKPDLAAL